MNGVPFFVPNGYMMPNEYPNVNSMQNQDIKSLENKLNHLEKEINNLKNKVNRLENMNNYSSNYQTNSYNMM